MSSRAWERDPSGTVRSHGVGIKKEEDFQVLSNRECGDECANGVKCIKSIKKNKVKVHTRVASPVMEFGEDGRLSRRQRRLD